jgi:hypothetical protein
MEGELDPTMTKGFGTAYSSIGYCAAISVENLLGILVLILFIFLYHYDVHSLPLGPRGPSVGGSSHKTHEDLWFSFQLGLPVA